MRPRIHNYNTKQQTESRPADFEQLVTLVRSQAEAIGSFCGLFTGKERTMQEVADILFSPQGMEFCQAYSFPTLSTYRLFKPFDPEQYGIYIDSGDIILDNPERVCLVGRTTATVRCNTLATHRVALLHGAHAVVEASGWAVVRLDIGRGCDVMRNRTGSAIIIEGSKGLSSK